MSDLKKFAREYILDQANDVDFLSLYEMYELDEKETEELYDLIITAKVAVNWD